MLINIRKKMKPTSKFYDVYKPPSVVPQAQVSRVRKTLLESIEVPEECRSKPFVESVRIHILTPVLRSQERRQIGKMRIFEPIKTVPTPKPLPKKEKQEAKAPLVEHLELERMTISRKKFQRNAKLSGLHVKPKKAKTELHANLIASLGSEKGLPAANQGIAKEQSETAQRKEKMKKALNYLIDYATKLRKMVRGNKVISPVLYLPTEPQEEEKRTEKPEAQRVVLSRHEEEKVQPKRKGRLLEKSISPTHKLPLNRPEEKRKKRRNTATVETPNTLAGALEQLALAPISK